MKVRFVSVFIQTDLVQSLIDCLLSLLKSGYVYLFQFELDI